MNRLYIGTLLGPLALLCGLLLSAMDIDQGTEPCQVRVGADGRAACHGTCPGTTECPKLKPKVKHVGGSFYYAYCVCDPSTDEPDCCHTIVYVTSDEDL